jgi:hypothetical protein
MNGTYLSLFLCALCAQTLEFRSKDVCQDDRMFARKQLTIIWSH